MKSILLTTTALVAFAGAAFADGHAGISFSGNAALGFNDGEETAVAVDGEDGFYWDADVDVTMSAALDNGLTATAQFEIDVVDETNGQDLASDGYVLSLESENAGLFYGDTGFAADSLWASAGDMESDGFSENDGENVIRGEVSVSGVDLAVSYAITDAAGVFVRDTAGAGDDVDQLSVGVAGEFGMFSVAAAYQEESNAAFGAAANAANEDYNPSEIYGISAGVAVAGADITLAYASNETADTSSTGIKVAYPIGPVTATAYYVNEEGGLNEDPNMGLKIDYADGPIAASLDLQDDQGTSKWLAEGSYDVGNGLTVLGGILNENEGDDADYYVAGVYDMGGGAELLISYAMDDDEDQADEVGSPEYLPGTTVEISFSF